MNVDDLAPAPFSCEMFRRNNLRFVPDRSGCYVLSTIGRAILYIGLADNLRRRMNDHLDNPAKTAETLLGRAVMFHWIETPETQKIERTWMDAHIRFEGSLPLLNKIYSPTAT